MFGHVVSQRLLILVPACIAACAGPDQPQVRPEPAPYLTEDELIAEAVAAAEAYLETDPEQVGPTETFTFIRARRRGDQIRAEFRGQIPEFALYAHSLATVFYDPATKTITRLRRGRWDD